MLVVAEPSPVTLKTLLNQIVSPCGIAVPLKFAVMELAVEGFTVTVIEALAVPPGPVAVSTYAVVVAGAITIDPFAGCDAGIPLMETDVAFAVTQLSLVLCPAMIVDGVAVNEITCGT